MPWIQLPGWLSLLAQSHFWIVCAAVCCVCVTACMTFDELPMGSGQLGKAINAFLSLAVFWAGIFLCIEIYRSANRLGLGHGTPLSPLIHLVAIFIFGIILVLLFRDPRVIRRANRKVPFTTQVSVELDNHLRSAAKRDGIKLAELLERALKAYEDRRQENNARPSES